MAVTDDGVTSDGVTSPDVTISSVTGGAVVGPGDNYLLEDGFNLLLESGTPDVLLLE
jgi:hypothetical protein